MELKCAVGSEECLCGVFECVQQKIVFGIFQNEVFKTPSLWSCASVGVGCGESKKWESRVTHWRVRGAGNVVLNFCFPKI